MSDPIIVAALITAVGSILGAVLGGLAMNAGAGSKAMGIGLGTGLLIGLLAGVFVAQRINTTATPTAGPNTTAASGLTPDDVRSWCEGANCTADRFEQLKESNGVINPKGVHMKTGNPVVLNIPSGISVDVWDCFNTTSAIGATKLPQVCEASFRRLP